jgi:hypothetical protein
VGVNFTSGMGRDMTCRMQKTTSLQFISTYFIVMHILFINVPKDPTALQ